MALVTTTKGEMDESLLEKVEGYIDEALTKGHDFPDWSRSYTKEHVQSYLTSGQWLLFVAVDDQNEVQGAATISFINYPNDRIGYITSIGGRLIANRKTFTELCEILKHRGATKIQGLGRPSIVRLWNRLGFEPISTLVEYKL